MPEDRSLDEFLDAGEGTDSDDSDSEAEADEPAGDDESIENDDEPAGDDETGADAGSVIADEQESGDETGVLDPDAVDPAEATYDWSPDGAACDACEETVERRWLGDAGYVCADCKEW